ncbi:hypothetical protein [Janthinobacterium sp. 1_2014MBL_MicDiv]|uniref:hypothetical protein n=1 Tax=Janthinobacterium sp. 1_2014MBL_MicDiv TaxID=1644131 RepID=UPI0018DD3DEE|nr:hypothetical protein [Janthinobacterium sp. 1_2014MBL_MicDiv]
MPSAINSASDKAKKGRKGSGDKPVMRKSMLFSGRVNTTIKPASGQRRHPLLAVEFDSPPRIAVYRRCIKKAGFTDEAGFFIV